MSEYNANQLSVNEDSISREQAIEKVKAYICSVGRVKTMKSMTKSKMRIYGGRGYSDHATELRLIFDQDDVAYLRMEYLFQKTRMEYIRIPADDVILALWPRILKHIDTVLQNEH